MKKKTTVKEKAKKAYIDKTSDEYLFDEVRHTQGFKRGYEKEIIAELIAEIKSERIKRHMSQHELAKLIGTKQQVVARLESKGASDMKLSTFLTITNALKLDAYKLLHVS